MFDYDKMDQELVTRKANLRQIEALCAQAPDMLAHAEALRDWSLALYDAIKQTGTFYLPDALVHLRPGELAETVKALIATQSCPTGDWMTVGLAPLVELIKEEKK